MTAVLVCVSTSLFLYDSFSSDAYGKAFVKLSTQAGNNVKHNVKTYFAEQLMSFKVSEGLLDIYLTTMTILDCFQMTAEEILKFVYAFPAPAPAPAEQQQKEQQQQQQQPPQQQQQQPPQQQQQPPQQQQQQQQQQPPQQQQQQQQQPPQQQQQKQQPPQQQQQKQQQQHQEHLSSAVAPFASAFSAVKSAFSAVASAATTTVTTTAENLGNVYEVRKYQDMAKFHIARSLQYYSYKLTMLGNLPLQEQLLIEGGQSFILASVVANIASLFPQSKFVRKLNTVAGLYGFSKITAAFALGNHGNARNKLLEFLGLDPENNVLTDKKNMFQSNASLMTYLQLAGIKKNGLNKELEGVSDVIKEVVMRTDKEGSKILKDARKKYTESKNKERTIIQKMIQAANDVFNSPGAKDQIVPDKFLVKAGDYPFINILSVDLVGCLGASKGHYIFAGEQKTNFNNADKGLGALSAADKEMVKKTNLVIVDYLTGQDKKETLNEIFKMGYFTAPDNGNDRSDENFSLVFQEFLNGISEAGTILRFLNQAVCANEMHVEAVFCLANSKKREEAAEELALRFFPFVHKNEVYDTREKIKRLEASIINEKNYGMRNLLVIHYAVLGFHVERYDLEQQFPDNNKEYDRINTEEEIDKIISFEILYTRAQNSAKLLKLYEANYNLFRKRGEEERRNPYLSSIRRHEELGLQDLSSLNQNHNVQKRTEEEKAALEKVNKERKISNLLQKKLRKYLEKKSKEIGSGVKVAVLESSDKSHKKGMKEMVNNQIIEARIPALQSMILFSDFDMENYDFLREEKDKKTFKVAYNIAKQVAYGENKNNPYALHLAQQLSQDEDVDVVNNRGFAYLNLFPSTGYEFNLRYKYKKETNRKALFDEKFTKVVGDGIISYTFSLPKFHLDLTAKPKLVEELKKHMDAFSYLSTQKQKQKMKEFYINFLAYQRALTHPYEDLF